VLRCLSASGAKVSGCLGAWVLEVLRVLEVLSCLGAYMLMSCGA